MNTEADAHPALPLIVLAETTPAFGYNTLPAEEACAVASQVEPETLPEDLLLRLAVRFAKVLWAAKAHDRLPIWQKIAAEHAQDHPQILAELAVLEAREAINLVRLPINFEALPFAAALERAQEQVDALGEAAPAPLRTRLALAHAEAASVLGYHQQVLQRLSPLPAHPDHFDHIEDLWRVQRLLARAHQMRLDAVRGYALFEVNAELSLQQEAPLDAGEALIGQAECALALGRAAEAAELLQRAQSLAPSNSPVFRSAAASTALLMLSEGRTEDALQQVRSAAIEAAQNDQHYSYVEFVRLYTHILRILQRHEQALRELLGIYGRLKGNLGDAAAAPILALIEYIERDLGPERYEALAAQLLAERKAK